MTPLYILIVLICSGATPLKTNNENPNGGVKKLVCKFSEINIPSHKGSAPLAIKLGPTSGIMTNMISI